MVKYKYLLLPALLLVFLFLNADLVFALEISLPGLNANSSVGELVVYLFKTGIALAGGLALISFAWGAVMLIASGDSTEIASSAKDRMKGAILGLVLVASSWLILNTINTAFTGTLALKPLPAAPVINTTPIIQTGVYYYLNSCTTSGPATESGSAAYTSSQSQIEEAYAGKIKFVKIVNDPTNKIYYGVIFHNAIGLENGGQCSLPITGDGCHPVDIKAYAADILRLNWYPIYSGNGVTFYSEPYGWNTGQNAGFINIPDKEINFPYSERVRIPPTSQCPNPTALCFDYTNVNGADELNCKLFQDCPGSIDIKGSYLVALYSKKSCVKPSDCGTGTGATCNSQTHTCGGASGIYCQTFGQGYKGAWNLNAQPIVSPGAGAKALDSVYIIPTK